MKNKVASILFGIGIATIGFGIIGSIYLASEYGMYYGFDWLVFLVGSIASLISGMIHIGFAEVINLLQQSVDAQKDALLLADIRNTKGQGVSARVVNDIEADLPKL